VFDVFFFFVVVALAVVFFVVVAFFVVFAVVVAFFVVVVAFLVVVVVFASFTLAQAAANFAEPVAVGAHSALPTLLKSAMVANSIFSFAFGVAHATSVNRVIVTFVPDEANLNDCTPVSVTVVHLSQAPLQTSSFTFHSLSCLAFSHPAAVKVVNFTSAPRTIATSGTNRKKNISSERCKVARRN
jgi:hypothetical protein